MVNQRMKRIIMIVLLACLLASCTVSGGENVRFIDTEDKSSPGYPQAQIIIDTETGVQYLWVHGGYSGGLSVLVDADGKPLLWDEVDE